VSAAGNNGYGNFTATATTAGSYTYTISCGPGSLPATASITLNFVSGPPSATLTADPATSDAIVGAASLPPNLSWIANVTPCSITYTGPESGTVISGAPAGGSIADVRSLAGTYTYTVSCGTGANQTQGTAQIVWTQPAPLVNLLVQSFPGVAGLGVPLEVLSNVRPCVASGGAAGDGWSGALDFPANNTYSVIEAGAGTYTYTVTCGVGPYGTAQASVVFDNPGGAVLTLTGSGPGGTTAYATQPVTLSWNSQVGPCTEYGGGMDDGWGGPQPNSGSTSVVHRTADPETYTMTCGAGSQQVAAQITLNWQIPPYPDVKFTWDQSHDALTGTALTLSWTGVAGASCTATGGNAGDGWTGSLAASGSLAITEVQAGYAYYGMTCNIGDIQGNGSAAILWRPKPPTVTLSAVPDHTYPGLPVQLTWSSENASQCTSYETEPGGIQGIWTGPVAPSGTHTAMQTQNVIGTFQYAVNCVTYDNSVSSAPGVATATVTYTAAPQGTVSLTSNMQTVAAGSSFQLNWSTTNESNCNAFESPSGSADGWSGQKSLAGSQSITETIPATYQFQLDCGEGVIDVAAMTTVTVTAAASSDKGSGGGGGAIDLRVLLALAMIFGRRASAGLRARAPGART